MFQFLKSEVLAGFSESNVKDVPPISKPSHHNTIVFFSIQHVLAKEEGKEKKEPKNTNLAEQWFLFNTTHRPMDDVASTKEPQQARSAPKKSNRYIDGQVRSV